MSQITHHRRVRQNMTIYEQKVVIKNEQSTKVAENILHIPSQPVTKWKSEVT